MWKRGGRWLGVALIALLAPVGAALGQGPGDGVHDLEQGNDEFCVYCHAESSDPDPGPVSWNPEQNAGAYTLYRSATLDMTVAGAPQGMSLVCLSCHDGTGTGGHGRGRSGPVTDLSSHHPISVTYDPGRDRNFADASGGQVGTLPLYGDGNDQLECATCHHPHDNSLGAYLRLANQRDALCLTCHRM